MTDEEVVQILLDDFFTREHLPLRKDVLNKYEDLFDVLPDLDLRGIVAPWKEKFLMVLPDGLALATGAHRDRLAEWVDGTKEAFAEANRSDENKEWTIDELCCRTGLPPFAIKVALLYRARFLSGCLGVGFSDEDGFPVASRFGFEIRRPAQTLIERIRTASQPAATKDAASGLRARLTNGESPKLDQQAPFVVPPLRDVDATVLMRGTQVLLITATHTEREAALQRLQSPVDQQQVLRVFADSQTYYVGRLGSVDVVLTTCRAGSQPRDGSAMATYEAILRVRPRAVMAVGIAFGAYTDRLRIGDVLVSTRLIPYEPQRKQAGGDISRGGEHDAGALLLNRFLDARGWTFPRSDGYGCRLREGGVLSGEKLVDSLEFKTELFDSHPEAVGGEMEGSGVYAASTRLHISEWLIVKAVCDWGDGTKHEQFQSLAATAAVALVEHVFTPIGVLDDLPPFRHPDHKNSAIPSAPNVVNVANMIGTQNIVHGNQTIVSAVSGDLDAVLSNIKALLTSGLVKEAGTSIDEADTRMWDRMDASQRARLRALRAWRKVMLGDEAAAALDFHDAHDQNPNNEKALVYKCQAYELQGLTTKAHQEAAAALARYTSDPSLRALLVRTASAEASIDDLLLDNWREIAIPSDVAVAVSERVRRSDSALAETVLRRVSRSEQGKPEYCRELGTLLVQRIEEAEDARQEVAPSLREEAIKALETGVAGIREPGSEVARGQLALMISLQSKRLGRDDQRTRWLEVAAQLIPDDVLVITNRAQDAYDRGDHTLATTLLRPIIIDPRRPGRSRLLFAHSLLKLNSEDSIREACLVLDTIAADASEPLDDRHRAALMLVEAQFERDRAATIATIERHSSALGNYRANKWRLIIAHESGQQDEVESIVARMMASKAEYDPKEMLDFGETLGYLRIRDACIQVLEEIAPRTALTPPTIALLSSAMASGRWELVGSICSALRAAGVVDPQVIDAEAHVLTQRGDLTGALELVQEWLATHPGENKRLRLRLAHVACHLGRIELLPVRADELPEPTDSQPDLAVPIVQILRAAKQYSEARRFAYANFKRRRRDVWAWRALSYAGLPSAPVIERGERQMLQPEHIAGPGMAVRITENGLSRWLQLEEAEELATAEDECGPSHPMTLALSGKRVGERIEIQGPRFGFPARVVEIEAITTCFSRACQECNDSYGLQFKQDDWLHSFRVPDSVDELIAMLEAGLKAQYRSVETQLNAYAQDPKVSLHCLTEICGKSIFELFPFLDSNEVLVHAARPPERMKIGRESLQRTREIVVETTGICTLLMLEMVPQVRAYFTKIWVARATVDRLRAYIHRTVSENASGYMGLHKDQFVMLQRDQSLEAQRAEYLQRLLTFVEGWDIFSEKDRGLLASVSVDAWTRVAGGGTADSVHLSKRLGLALWMDDAVIAAAAEHEGAKPISTQAVFETLAELGLITHDELSEIGAWLVGWRHGATRVLPESFLAAAKLARWDAAVQPLKQHVELLSTVTWPEDILPRLLAEVFYLWWSNTLDRDAIDRLVFAVLMRLGRRENGERLLKLLPVAVHQRFGLEVIGASHLSEAIVGWIATNGPKIQFR